MEEEKKGREALRLAGKVVLKSFIKLAANLLLTAGILWLATNFFLMQFKFGIRLGYIQAVATMFLITVISWIFGERD